VGVKGCWCVKLTTLAPIIWKSGSLNLLEPSGPVKAFMGVGRGGGLKGINKCLTAVVN